MCKLPYTQIHIIQYKSLKSIPPHACSYIHDVYTHMHTYVESAKLTHVLHVTLACVPSPIYAKCF